LCEARSSSTCPSCGQKVEPEHFEKEIEEKSKYLIDINSQLKISAENVTTAESSSSELSENLVIAKKDYDEVSIKISEIEFSINSELKKYDEEIDNLDKDLQQYNSYKLQWAGIENKISSIKSLMESSSNVKNPYEEQITKLKNSIENIKEELKVAGDQVSSLELSYEDNKFWVKGFKDMKGLIISSITPMMNQRAKYYSSILTRDEFSINFVTQRSKKDGDMMEVFDIEVERYGGASNYDSMSSGEKRRIDVITMFVLDDLKKVFCKNSSDLTLRFYDEVFDSLDEIGVENLIRLLNELSKEKALYVISHRDDLKDLFSKNIVVVKKMGFSTIVQ